MSRKDSKRYPRFMYEGAEPFIAGIERKQLETLDKAYLNSLGKPLCIVADWYWIDLIVSPDESLVQTAQGVRPAVLVADAVIKDYSKANKKGHSVCSGQLVRFIDNYIFESSSRLFIMVGPGHRKSLPFKVFERIIYERNPFLVVANNFLMSRHHKDGC